MSTTEAEKRVATLRNEIVEMDLQIWDSRAQQHDPEWIARLVRHRDSLVAQRIRLEANNA